MIGEEDSFEAHLRDAIAQNLNRRPVYVRSGGMRAWTILSLQILAERASLPTARRWDREAKVFQAEGVPILQAELAQMSDAPDINSTIADCAAPDRAVARALKDEIRGYGCKLRQPIDKHDLKSIDEITRDLWNRLQKRQLAARLHAPLLIHVLESLGAFARHGREFGHRTDGRSVPLSLKIIKGHAQVLRLALWLDIRAWPLHHLGIGLLINDLPPIPFPETKTGAEGPPLPKSEVG